MRLNPVDLHQPQAELHRWFPLMNLEHFLKDQQKYRK